MSLKSQLSFVAEKDHKEKAQEEWDGDGPGLQRELKGRHIQMIAIGLSWSLSTCIFISERFTISTHGGII